MVHHARGAAKIGGSGNDLPAFVLRGGEKTVHLRTVADAVQQRLAAMNGELRDASAVVGETVGLVENAGEKDSGHALPLAGRDGKPFRTLATTLRSGCFIRQH